MRAEDEKDISVKEENTAASEAAEDKAAETEATAGEESAASAPVTDAEAEQADDRAFEEGASSAEAEDAAAPDAENEEEYFSEKQPPKRRKRLRRKDMTPEQKRRRTIRDLIITGTVFGVVLVFFAICALCSWVGYSGNFDYIANEVQPVDYDSAFTLINPSESDTGYYEFVASSEEDEFKVLHLTDVHIGAGAFSAQKDRWALEAVSTIVHRAKPDLVIVTGDMAYPVPFQAGTFNNKREAEMFAALMEKLGVYWTITFGNHDTEIYSLYDRDEIASQVYMDKAKYPHCLFREGPNDIAGKGNDVIVVRHPQTAESVKITEENYAENVGSTKISQALVTIDSHSYTDGDYFGIAWKYDNIHPDQIDWYAQEMQKLTAKNLGYGVPEDKAQVKNLVFFHIPLTEYRIYWGEYKDNGHEDTDNVKFVHGKAGEDGEKSFPGVNNCQMFETMVLNGGQGAFCGHDHYNTFAIDVKATVKDKDGNDVTSIVRLSYGMSIDYLAYIGIVDDIEQRGGQGILISSDGNFSTCHYPYQGGTEQTEWIPYAVAYQKAN